MTKRYILTGGIASGKSTVVEMLKNESIDIIDADIISHKKFTECENEIRSMFNLSESGVELRKSVSNIVFNNPRERLRLENLLLPKIKVEIDLQENKFKDRVYVLDIPLYFEKKTNMKENDYVILVTIPYELQVQRLMQRNNLTKAEADKIILTQLPTSVKEKKSDYIIMNDGSIDDLKTNVYKMLHYVFYI